MFKNVLDDILTVFSLPNWTTQNIDMYPNDYQGAISNEKEYCRISVFPSNSQNLAHGDIKSLSGTVIIKIFVEAGEGQSRLMEVAEALDSVLQNKKLTRGTELYTSYLNVEGLDPSNQALTSASYIIPFTLYGE
ncbi:hypothetical protein N9Z41_02515 [bacterium]|nr:hypothetical protein [bacterium]